MARVKILQTQDGSWEGLYIDGVLVDQGCELGEGLSRMYLLQKAEEFKFTSKDVSFYELSDKDDAEAEQMGVFPSLESDLNSKYE